MVVSRTAHPAICSRRALLRRRRGGLRSNPQATYNVGTGAKHLDVVQVPQTAVPETAEDDIFAPSVLMALRSPGMPTSFIEAASIRAGRERFEHCGPDVAANDSVPPLEHGEYVNAFVDLWRGGDVCLRRLAGGGGGLSLATRKHLRLESDERDGNNPPPCNSLVVLIMLCFLSYVFICLFVVLRNCD